MKIVIFSVLLIWLVMVIIWTFKVAAKEEKRAFKEDQARRKAQELKKYGNTKTKKISSRDSKRPK